MDYHYITEDISPLVSAFSQYDTFALDIETTGLDPIDSRILLCQVGFKDKIFVVDASTVKLEPILPFLRSNNHLKIIQQAKFESKFFEFYYHTPINNVFDTLLAEQIINPDAFSNSLEALAERYLEVKLNKKTRETFYRRGNNGELTKAQLDYAAKDVEVLFPIMEAQKKKIESTNQFDVADLEFRLAKVVAHMELVGIPVDKSKWNDILDIYRGEHEESRLKMNALIFDGGQSDEQLGMFVRDGINLNSVPQMKKAFAAIGIDLENTNERTIALIKHPLAKELLIYRGLQKIMTSYGKSFLDLIHPFTGRLHPNFKQIGAETGRFACAEPNVQQIPERFRACIGNVENLTLVGADYSQIELRIIAELSEDERLSDAFDKGRDVHTTTASIMFNMPLNSVTKDQRFVAKTINFGISYGMGGKKLMDTLNAKGGKKVTLREAYILIDRHRKTYPKVGQWLKETGERAFREGISETMYGRKRFYTRPDRSSLSDRDYDNQVASIKRRGANTPIQGACADITKLAMVNLHDDLSEFGYKADIVIQVHDEVVVLAHKRQAEAVKTLVRESMLKSAQTLLQRVPVVVDVYANDVWEKGDIHGST